MAPDALAILTRAARAVSTTILTATDGRDVLRNSPDGWEVEQPWLWWSGPAGGDGTTYGNPIPGATYGVPGSGLPAVARCSSLIADTISGMPWKVYRDRDQIPTPDWIADPQGLRLDGRIVGMTAVDEIRLSAVEFWSQVILSMLWFGDGLIYAPTRDAAGMPRPPLWILHPSDVRISEGAYWVGDIQLPPASVIHVRGGPIRDGRGTGVLRRFAQEFALDAVTRDYAAGTLQSGVPAGYLKVTKDGLTQDAADNLKARWLTAHGGSRRSIAVLNATTEFHALQISPLDAQLVEQRRLNLLDVALIFGVPPYLLGAPADSATYANIESRMQEFYSLTLLPWIRRMEATLDAQFPRGTSVKVSMDSILRADTLTRYQAHTIGLAQGFLTVDEVRQSEDRPPMGETEQEATA